MPAKRRANNKRRGNRAPRDLPPAEGKNTMAGANPLVPRRQGDEWQIRGIPLFSAKSVRMLLRYADTFSLTSTTGAVASYVFSANGLYDPNITGTGHQPMGFDQMMVSYDHYTVLGARIRINARVGSVTNTFPTVAVSISASATPITNSQQITECGNAVLQFLYPQGIYGGMRTLENAVNISKFGGVRDILDNPYYRGDIAANPAEQLYFHVQTWDTELITCATSIDVVIEYEAIFTEPRQLSQSVTKSLIQHIRAEEKACVTK
jgi:hypothetical protein